MRPLLGSPTLASPKRTSSGPWYQLKGVLQEARPVVQAVFLLRLVAATGLPWQVRTSDAIAIAGWLPLTVAIYVFNGVTDIRSDIANGSARPIASGQLSRVAALRWCAGSAVIGLTCCWFVAPEMFVLGTILLTVGWAYSDGPALKNAPVGFGLIVGLGAALTYVAGWFAAGGSDTGALPVMLAIAAWVGLCCASKDFSDIDGDRLAGRHTWPIVLGPRAAARLLAVIALAASGLAVTGAILARTWIVPAAVLCCGSLMLAVVSVKSATNPDRSTRRRPYRAFLATQFAANVALICTGLL